MTKYISNLNRQGSRHRSVGPMRPGDSDFWALYEEISDGWEDKARQLQVRRWRKIKHQIS